MAEDKLGINGTVLNLEHLVLKGNAAANWDPNYVLLAGELGIELDTKKYKLGDGTKKWSELAYYSNPVTDSLIDGLTTKVDAAEGNISTLQSDVSGLKSADTAHETRMGTIEAKDTAQDGRLDALEAKDTTHETRMTNIETKDTAQDGRLDALERITTISANPFRE